MKVIELKDQRNLIIQILKRVMESHTHVCLWQNTNQKRLQYQFELLTMTDNPSSLNFNHPTSNDVEFNEGRVFCYCEDEAFIYTSNLVAVGKKKISLSLPTFLIQLNEEEKKYILSNDWAALSLILKNTKLPREESFMKTKKMLTEEQRYENVREAPRGKAKEKKTIELSQIGVSSSEATVFELFDLSKGGMAITSKLKSFLEQDMKVHVHVIGEDHLDSPITGVVRSVSQAHEKSTFFKYGIQFLEE